MELTSIPGNWQLQWKQKLLVTRRPMQPCFTDFSHLQPVSVSYPHGSRCKRHSFSLMFSNYIWQPWCAQLQQGNGTSHVPNRVKQVGLCIPDHLSWIWIPFLLLQLLMTSAGTKVLYILRGIWQCFKYCLGNLLNSKGC